MQGLVEEVRKYVIPFLLDFANKQEQRQATTSQAQSRNCSSYTEVMTIMLEHQIWSVYSIWVVFIVIQKDFRIVFWGVQFFCCYSLA